MEFGTPGKLIVRNCTLFLCSLDVGDIAQDGDPLYVSVNHKQRCGRHNGSSSFLLLGREIFFFFWLQNFIFWAQGFFPDLFNTNLVKPDQLEPDRSHQGLDQ